MKNVMLSGRCDVKTQNTIKIWSYTEHWTLNTEFIAHLRRNSWIHYKSTTLTIGLSQSNMQEMHTNYRTTGRTILNTVRHVGAYKIAPEVKNLKTLNLEVWGFSKVFYQTSVVALRNDTGSVPAESIDRLVQCCLSGCQASLAGLSQLSVN